MRVGGATTTVPRPSRRQRRLLLAVLAVAVASGAAGASAAQEASRADGRPAAAEAKPEGPPRAERSPGSAAAFEDLVGTVVALDLEEAEGGLPVVTLDLRTDGGERRVALAPQSVLAEAGFEVAEGDRVRVRVFVREGEGTAAAQKVMNLSRNHLLRLRTFSRAPIWDAQGRWEGSPTRGDETTRRRRPTRRPTPPPTRPPPSRTPPTPAR